jgi:hypothetical protein
MQITGKLIWQMLADHGWSPNPAGYISPFFVEQTDGKLYVDVNAAAIRYGNKPDEMPDYPVRIYFTPLNSPSGTVGLDVGEIRELGADEPSNAEARRDFYPKKSPWPDSSTVGPDPPCKRTGCQHALSLHNLSPAEKRAKVQGTMLSDFPSAQPDRAFNIQTGSYNSSCSESGCDCFAYISPTG